MRKNILVTLLTIILAVASSLPVFALHPDTTLYLHENETVLIADSPFVQDLGAYYLQNFLRARYLREALIDSMSLGRNTSPPDFYGGRYIDSNGNLVVLIVDSIPHGRTAIDSVFESIPGSEYIITRSATFSYNEMVDIVNYINAIRGQVIRNEIIHPAAWNIVSLSVNIRLNRVNVFLRDYSEEQINLFRETLIDSPAIFFNQHQPFFSYTLLPSPEPPPCPPDFNDLTNFATDDAYIEINNINPLVTGPALWAGDIIWFRLGSSWISWASAGFSALVDDTIRGFTTAAHALPDEVYDGMRVANSQGQFVGTIDLSKPCIPR